MTTPTTYACLVENNDWEGERWKFYIPVEGNEDAIAALTEHLRREMSGDDPPFYMSGKRFTSAEVEARVTIPNGEATYMAAHNQLAGTLTLPDPMPTGDDLANLLYKGKILAGWSGLTKVAECPLDDEDEEDY